jgi:hypothetical protein
MHQPRNGAPATRDYLYTQVITWVGESLRRFEARDESAFRSRDVYEWACAFRLAVYLDRLVEEAVSANDQCWNVDYEYNRQGDGQANKAGPSGDIRPDIIIHRRGKGEIEHNLLFLEVKRCWNVTGNVGDLGKVEAAVKGKKPNGECLEYQYRFGAALGLWIHDGGRCENDRAGRRFDPHWVIYEEDGPGGFKRSEPSRVPMLGTFCVE